MNIKGEISGATSVDVQIWKFEFEKENKKVLQLDIEIKELKDGMWHIFNPYFEATINYNVLDGDTSGTVLLRFEKTTGRERRFTIRNTDQSFELIISHIIVNPGNNHTIQIEYKENEKLTGHWKIRHERLSYKVPNFTLDSEIELTSESKIYQYLHEKHPNLAFNSTGFKLKILAEKYWEIFLKKYQIQFKLEKDGLNIVDFIADTFVDPHEFKLIAPNTSIIPSNLGMNQPSSDMTVDYHPGSQQDDDLGD